MGEVVVPKCETELFFVAVLKRELVGLICVSVVLHARNNHMGHYAKAVCF